MRVRFLRLCDPFFLLISFFVSLFFFVCLSVFLTHLCSLSLVCLLSPERPSGVWGFMDASSLPQCLRAEDPSVGFLLSLLRGPQRLLIISDLLAPLSLSASPSGPPQPSQVSSLPMYPFYTVFAPSNAQNNPRAWLQSLITAITETKMVFGARRSWRSVKERGSDNTCAPVESQSASLCRAD